MSALFIIFSILSIALFALIAWIKTLIEIITHEYHGYNKIIWLIFVFMMPILGMIFYHLFGQNEIMHHTENSYV